jgi:hypothetical protein
MHIFCFSPQLFSPEKDSHLPEVQAEPLQIANSHYWQTAGGLGYCCPYKHHYNWQIQQISDIADIFV